jgi:hypothetical protein
MRRCSRENSDNQHIGMDSYDSDSEDESVINFIQELLTCRGEDIVSLSEDSSISSYSNVLSLDSIGPEYAVSRTRNFSLKDDTLISLSRPFSIARSLRTKKGLRTISLTPNIFSRGSGLSSSSNLSSKIRMPLSFSSLKTKSSKSNSTIDRNNQSDDEGNFDNCIESGLGSKIQSTTGSSRALSFASQGPCLTPVHISRVSRLSSTDNVSHLSNRILTGHSSLSIRERFKSQSSWNTNSDIGSMSIFSMSKHDDNGQILSILDSFDDDDENHVSFRSCVSIVDNDSILSNGDGTEIAIEVELLDKDLIREGPFTIISEGLKRSSVCNKKGRVLCGILLLLFVTCIISVMVGFKVYQGSMSRFSQAQEATIYSDYPTISPSSMVETTTEKVPLSPSSLPSVNGPANPLWIQDSFTPTVESQQRTSIPSLIPKNSQVPFPTIMKTILPTTEPSRRLTSKPTFFPTSNPSYNLNPTSLPSIRGSETPSYRPSIRISIHPSIKPASILTMIPSGIPTIAPSQLLSYYPSREITRVPSEIPSFAPTQVGSDHPSPRPSAFQTFSSSEVRSNHPSLATSWTLTISPSKIPTTDMPSILLSTNPSEIPTFSPTRRPFQVKSEAPSRDLSISPTNNSSKSFDALLNFALAYDLWPSSDPESPLNLALNWAKSHDYPASRQRISLATLYYSTNGNDWLDTLNFLSEENECTWNILFVDTKKGVLCDDDGNVAALSLCKLFVSFLLKISPSLS